MCTNSHKLLSRFTHHLLLIYIRVAVIPRGVCVNWSPVTHIIPLLPRVIKMPYSFAVEPSISSFATSRTEQGVLRSGPVKSSQWNQIQLDGLYQLVVCEVRQDGITYPLDRGSRQAFAVASVLDLGLRMLESSRGRDCKNLLSSSRFGY